MTTLRDRVAAGIAALDRRFTKRDWRSDIDLETLDIRKRSCCILGQLYGDYGRAPKSLIARPDLAFTANFDSTNASYFTREWKRQLRGEAKR